MVTTRAIPTGGSGNKIVVSIAALPLCDRTEPKDVSIIANGTARANGQTITATVEAKGPEVVNVIVDDAAGILVNATSITVESLPRELPSGTALVFNAGTPQQTSTSTDAVAAAGATNLSVLAVPAPITDNSVAAVNLDGVTSMTVSALPTDLEDGSQVTFNQGSSTEQTVTLTAAASASATAITVEPLTNTISAGNEGRILPDTQIQVQQLTGSIAGTSPIVFNRGEINESVVILTEDALAGSTTLKFKNLIADITPGSTAEYIARLRILGGTATGLSLNTNREEIQFFEDPLGFTDGAATNGTWSVPWSCALTIDDLAYLTALEIAYQAPSNGREAYVWVEDPPNKGGTRGNVDKGASLITDFNKDLSSSGILTVSWTFSGQGSPTQEFNGVAA